ncbi:MAG: uncharacterized protein JWM51_2223 [Microbacteriaceae bacterium]|nr:uncharacterized protein [Microbacteriaceae bacterium]
MKAGFAPEYVPYDVGWQLQRRVHQRVVSGESADTLILLEHEAVFTAGTRTSADERPTDGTPVVDVDRGGKITWHGPGQLIGYPILRLPQPVDGVAYVRRLESVLIGVLADYGIHGESVRGRTGVWVRSAEGMGKYGSTSDGGNNDGLDKIAAIGVRVADGVSMHGFALNCSNSLDPFSQIVPCGIRDAGVTSIGHATGALVTPLAIVDAVVAAFQHELTVAA